MTESAAKVVAATIDPHGFAMMFSLPMKRTLREAAAITSWQLARTK
jgi:hypothetical protein